MPSEETALTVDGEESDGETVTVWRRADENGESDGLDHSETVEALYQQLFGASLGEWVDHYAVGQEKLTSYGMNPAALTVTVRYTETVDISGEDTSTVTKEVERVTGFLIGGRLTDGEEAEETSYRHYFMLEGGTVHYVLGEDEISAVWNEGSAS